jgi:hypothetical protein
VQYILLLDSDLDRIRIRNPGSLNYFRLYMSLYTAEKLCVLTFKNMLFSADILKYSKSFRLSAKISYSFIFFLFLSFFIVRYRIRHVYFAIVEIYEYIFFYTREGSVVSVCNMNGFIQFNMTKLLFAIVLCSIYNVCKVAEID